MLASLRSGSTEHDLCKHSLLSLELREIFGFYRYISFSANLLHSYVSNRCFLSWKIFHVYVLSICIVIAPENW